jgi:NAD(P)-dependent dehydrogenase (short-subunit alcohol dehydrogenase family)
VRALAPERIAPVELDVTDDAQIAAAAQRASSTGLYGVVNNAGMAAPAPLEFLELDDLRHQLEVNVVGQLAVTQAVLPLLRASRGRVVMVTSIGGRMAFPFNGAYHASKYALEGLSDALRMELAPLGVRVAIIEPGSVKTEIWRKGFDRGREVMAELPREAIDLYGDRMDGLMESTQKVAQRGVEPVEVAETIAKALTARRPKARYVVGADAKAQTAMKALLPTRVLDGLTRRATKT